MFEAVRAESATRKRHKREFDGDSKAVPKGGIVHAIVWTRAHTYTKYNINSNYSHLSPANTVTIGSYSRYLSSLSL